MASTSVRPPGTAGAPTTGLLNLERELVCFICTEVLFQPLTIIDCLHTFCGSCLKVWFQHQARRNHAYTCPTCRAPALDCQHNAMINTLLDMFLQANPGKVRSPEERAEESAAYTPGENILPKVERSRRAEHRARRREEEAAARGHRDTEVTNGRRHADLQVPASAARRETRSRSNEHGSRPHSNSGRQERRNGRERGEGISIGHTANAIERGQNAARSPPPTSPRHPEAVERRSREPAVAHQPSIRSLISASESSTGSGEGISEAQLMQDILNEGLLDGINLEELTEAQQDELSVIIAERYRQLHPDRVPRSTARDDAAGVESRSADMAAAAPVSSRPGTIPSATPVTSNHRPNRTQERSDLGARASNANTSTVMALERSQSAETATLLPGQNLSPPSRDRHHRRRSSDQHRSRDSSSGRNTRFGPSAYAEATRSNTDLSTRPRSRTRGQSDPPNPSLRPGRVQTEPTNPSTIWTGNQPSHHTASTATTNIPEQFPRNVEIQPPTRAAPPVPAPVIYDEPSISCIRCSRQDIQYNVHKHCQTCRMDLCLTCFRAGRGCDHWYGFGRAAMTKFAASRPVGRHNQPVEFPHRLLGRQYQPPPPDTIVASGNEEDASRRARQPKTTSDPTSRLQEGQFCDLCNRFANTRFWACDYCNDGEWGYCNTCVTTHHCCNHPLTPMAHKSLNSGQQATFLRPLHSQAAQDNLYPPNAMLNNTLRPSPAHSAASSTTSLTDYSAGPLPDYVQLTITTDCDVCHQPIPSSDPQYHCPFHPTSNSSSSSESEGDYDICSPCYRKLVKSGAIKPEDGPSGWRLCPSGHRMIVAVLEADSEGNQRRMIPHDLVGGRTMTEADILAWKEAAKSSQNSGNQHEHQGNTNPSNPPPTKGAWTWQDDTSGSNRRTRVRTSTLVSASNASGISDTMPVHESLAQKFPPDGGIGRRCVALWSWYPKPGDEGKGELMFPRHAEIAEVEEVNEEWFFGVYAGKSGVFPSVYVRDLATLNAVAGSTVGR